MHGARLAFCVLQALAELRAALVASEKEVAVLKDIVDAQGKVQSAEGQADKVLELSKKVSSWSFACDIHAIACAIHAIKSPQVGAVPSICLC